MNTFYPTITQQIKHFPIYLTSMGIYYEETMTKRETGYKDYQWIQTVSGSGELYFNNKRYVITPNTGLLIPAHIPHQYKRLSDNWITHWLAFNGSDIHTLFEQLELSTLSIIQPYDSQQLIRDMESIFQLVTSNYINQRFKVSSKVYQLLESIYASSVIRDNENNSSKASQLNVVIEYIHQYYMNELTITEIAKSIHVSPQYLCRLFKEQLNLRPFEYVQQVRINKAKSLMLQSPSPKIEDIIQTVGFQNPSYFASTFKKKEKITPRDFIKLHQRGV